LHRLAAERAEADGMLQDALAPIFQNGSRDRQHKDTILDEEMPAGKKRHRRRHVLAARLERFFWIGQLCCFSGVGRLVLSQAADITAGRRVSSGLTPHENTMIAGPAQADYRKRKRISAIFSQPLSA
jgi:hypothetical protein